MIEKYAQPTGYFKIQLHNKSGDLLEEYEDKNLIVNSARTNIAKLVCGFTGGSSINKFIIGTNGWVNDVLTPKTIVDGLVPTVTELFAETPSTDPDYQNYTYSIEFDGTASNNGFRNVTWETDRTTDNQTVSTVSVTETDNSVTYVITIPSSVANNVPTNFASFTEAGFYCGNTLFNIKTFPVKVKDSSTQITITWVLSF